MKGGIVLDLTLFDPECAKNKSINTVDIAYGEGPKILLATVKQLTC